MADTLTPLTIPKPGAIVWYRNHFGDKIPQLGDQPLAAIVAAVLADGCVNLSVIDCFGNHHPRQRIALVQPGDAKPIGAYAEWPDNR